MSNKKYSYAYLDIGEKSSPILRDSSIDTGRKETVYLFNLKRDKVLEYKRDIVEPKLRDLTDEEEYLVADLKKNYKKIRVNFMPRIASIIKPNETIIETPEVMVAALS